MAYYCIRNQKGHYLTRLCGVAIFDRTILTRIHDIIELQFTTLKKYAYISTCSYIETIMRYITKNNINHKSFRIEEINDFYEYVDKSNEREISIQKISYVNKQPCSCCGEFNMILEMITIEYVGGTKRISLCHKCSQKVSDFHKEIIERFDKDCPNMLEKIKLKKELYNI